ncbi:P-loop containing nucleoside triphosphate hydrolase protein [Obelidium mucronatum]|nr:P-loop containing nucleoside triphosphate hydrolase protein [Obelidium mucronatum]
MTAAWTALLPARLQPAIARLGIAASSPSTVQTACFAPIAAGRSVLATAATGSGKTLAVLAPLFARVGAGGSGGARQVLVLAPSLALCRQTLKTGAAFGGAASLVPGPAGIPRRLLGADPWLLVATPHGLATAAAPGKPSQGAVRRGLAQLLRATDAVVVDECDLLLADESTRSIVFAIHSVAKKTLKKDLQWVMVAATLPPVCAARNHIMKLVPDIVLVEPETAHYEPPVNLKHSFIKVYNESESEVETELSAQDKENLENRELSAKFNLMTESIKLSIAAESKEKLHKHQWLIFCNEKGTVDFLVNQLRIWCDEEGLSEIIQMAGVHKETPEDTKSSLVSRFSSGTAFGAVDAKGLDQNPQFQILVATDLVSRGLDFPNVDKVFLFDFPSTVPSYFHRAGRTARKGGLGEGECVSFIGLKDRKVYEKVEDAVLRKRANN